MPRTRHGIEFGWLPCASGTSADTSANLAPTLTHEAATCGEFALSARAASISERGQVVDDDTMKFGLLMESAQAHQKLAETHLEKLRAHTQDLDGLVRDEIRRTLVDELKTLTAESDRDALALREMKRAANMRGVMWNIGIAILCTAIPTAIARFVLPSQSDIAAMRVQRDSLAQNIA